MQENIFLLARLFSEKTRGIAIALTSSLSSSSASSSSSLSSYCKKLSKFVISLLLLKILTRSMCSLSKKQTILSRETIQNTLFPRLCRFFDLDFLSAIMHPTTELWRPHAVLVFFCLNVGI